MRIRYDYVYSNVGMFESIGNIIFFVVYYICKKKNKNKVVQILKFHFFLLFLSSWSSAWIIFFYFASFAISSCVWFNVSSSSSIFFLWDCIYFKYCESIFSWRACISCYSNLRLSCNSCPFFVIYSKFFVYVCDCFYI